MPYLPLACLEKGNSDHGREANENEFKKAAPTAVKTTCPWTTFLKNAVTTGGNDFKKTLHPRLCLVHNMTQTDLLAFACYGGSA
jgi:hypothetical protein